MSYADVRRKIDEQKADEQAEVLMACRVCSSEAPRDDLSKYGARCGRCFNSWQREQYVQREPSRYAKVVQAYNAKYRRHSDDA